MTLRSKSLLIPATNISNWFVLVLFHLTASLLILPGNTQAQTPEELAELLLIKALHPLTGGDLSMGIPYPIGGVLGDGSSDKIPFHIEIDYNRPEGELRTVEEIMSELQNIRFSIQIGEDLAHPDDPEPIYFEIDRMSSLSWKPTHRTWNTSGEIDLSFDAIREAALAFQAILLMGDQPLDTFYTEIKPGSPELRIRSTIISDNMIGAGIKVTSTISGQTGLEFSSDYLTLTGRGPIEYEEFEIIHPQPQCNIRTTKTGGSWRVNEVVLGNSLEQLLATADSLETLPPPVEMVVFIDPNIKESATIRCPPNPIAMPLPKLIHFFAGFYSMHGGEVANFPNEMDEDRGGLVMGNWVPGTGGVIATRTYSRQGPLKGDAALKEETILELRWPE